MKKKNELEKKIDFVMYDKYESIPSYIIQQIIKLSNQATLDYSNYLLESRDCSTIELANWHSFEKISKNSKFIVVQTNVSEYNVKVIGYLQYFETKDALTRICIHNIYVEKEFRKNGYGSKLVRELYSKYNKTVQYEISVYNNNQTGKRFWNNLGFLNTPICSTYILQQ